MAIIAAGRITTSCLPGHHQPCIVRATHVATPQPTQIQKTKSKEFFTRFRRSEATEGTSAKNAGVQGISPNCSSNRRPDKRRVRAGILGLLPKTSNSPFTKWSPVAYTVQPP